MPDPQTAPYGSWKSPITSDLIVAGSIRLGQIQLDGEDVYWNEERPTEGGRSVIVRRTPDGQTTDINPAPFNARTRVHEYGGGSFAVFNGSVFFANFADQRLYRQDPGEPPRPITPGGELRYADATLDPPRHRLICVREDHTVADREAVNTIVTLGLDGRDEPLVLVEGHDFYSTPRLSPDGSKLAWLAWNHPNMPWDGTELWVADLGGALALVNPRLIAGGGAPASGSESIFQPEWSPDGTLYFVSDRNGWWNLYRWRRGARERAEVEPVLEREAEMGLPQWLFGLRTYAFVSGERIVCIVSEAGADRLGSLDIATGALTWLQTPYTQLTGPQAHGSRVTLIAGSPSEAPAVVQIDLAASQSEVLRRSNNVSVDPGYLSYPQAIEFPTENGLTAHGLFYLPQNRDFVAPAGEKPPLLVKSHGGPTSAAASALNLTIQYWTSRGIAVLDVNYGGSTGYGRAYRERLKDRWGIVDVDDCVNGARYLAQQGLVDSDRLAIDGGSAGGYTTLSALTFRDAFKAGASFFGVADLEALARDTHKFESRYLDGLIGPYPERTDLYHARSPIYHADRLNCPVILFQGLEDKIVPPNQAEMMAEALRAKGIPVAYVPFEGEQHGFRRAENIKRSLDGELYFFSRVFCFPLAEPVEPIPIKNMDE